MASKGIDSNTSRVALPPPTLARDNLGVYISISCGKVSGQLYLSKMSKKSPGKCVLVSGQWYSPLEVESLGGRRAKKWKQSLHHLRKPLADYDLSCFDLATGTGASLSTGLVTDLSSSSVQLSGDAVFPCSSQVQSGGTDSGSVSMSSPRSCTRPLLVDVVLSFVKAYRLKSDKESLTSVVTERFSAKEVEAAKGSLWEYCKVDLEAMDLVFHVRRDSDRRSQLAANLEDILQMFEALDSIEKIPHIHCEAFDLLRLPPLSLDPVAEQVQCNSQTLKSLASVIEKLENKLSSFIDSPKQRSYATMASSVPLTQPSAPAQQSQSQASLPAQRTSSRSPLADGRECNVILFGLPENQTIVEAKGVVDEMFDFLIGKQVQIKDILRLGRFRSPASPSSRPRPLLIKLCTVWDRKLLLLRKSNLREFRIKRLFLREDVAPDHKLRQRKPVPPSTASASGTSLPPVESATAEPANLLVKTPTPSTSAQALSSGVTQLSSPKLLLRHRSVSPAVLSRNSSLSRSVRSVSPSSDSSSCSTSTLVQDSESIHHGST